MWPRRKAVAEFRLATRRDCLRKHLSNSCCRGPFLHRSVILRDYMDTDRIHRCPALKGSSLCEPYRETRDLLGS
ncbi:hypothetical protein TNCV_944231 [Trichonephila clavipes]|nr:hypothetical protein TNCV_944231 [Trichonephila clavipes]